MMRKTLQPLVFAVVLLLGWSSAAPLEAVVNFPEGLAAGSKVPVEVTWSGDTDAFAGSEVGLVVDGGQNVVVNEVMLGKVGDPLRGSVSAPVTGTNRVSLKIRQAGKNYAAVQEVLVPSPKPSSLRLPLEAPITRTATPIPWLLVWVALTVGLGLTALRGKSNVF